MEKTEKIDLVSLKSAFNDEALKPEKTYRFVLDVSEPGYAPVGVKIEAGLTKTSTHLIGTATGSAVQALEEDEKVVHIAFTTRPVLRMRSPRIARSPKTPENN